MVPGVSVIIPAYAHVRYLRAAIESVLAQTFVDHEILVVDDGSPHGLAEHLAPLIDAGRIRYLRQPNAGSSAARNLGLRHARGELIAFLDEDDLWPADKLAWQVGALRADPGAVLVHGDHAVIDTDGRPVETFQVECHPSGDAHGQLLLNSWIVSPGQTLIRRWALARIGGFDRSLRGAEDWDLYLRLSRMGRFLHEPRTALYYRVHGQNASTRVLPMLASHLRVIQRHCRFRPLLAWRARRFATKAYVPRLIHLGCVARREGHWREALAAHLYAAGLAPTMLFRRSFVASLLGALCQFPPRRR